MEYEDEGRKLAEEAFMQSQQYKDPIYYINALLAKLQWNVVDNHFNNETKQRELLDFIEQAEKRLAVTNHISNPDRKRHEAYLKLLRGEVYTLSTCEKLDPALKSYEEALQIFKEFKNTR